MVPRDGFVSYQSSFSLTLDSFSTDHSAQPPFAVNPARVASRNFTNTVPELTAVGGVPQKIVCGFLDYQKEVVPFS